VPGKDHNAIGSFWVGFSDGNNQNLFFLFYFFCSLARAYFLDYFAKATPIIFSLATQITVLLDVNAEIGRTDVILGLKALLSRLRAWSHAAVHPPA
jgi:hypothetical protein